MAKLAHDVSRRINSPRRFVRRGFLKEHRVFFAHSKLYSAKEKFVVPKADPPTRLCKVKPCTYRQF